MVGAVQVGGIAACIVLFVPMVMAGWHLSRNKMLFFSAALFITLALCVHLTPYLRIYFLIYNENNSFSSNSINDHDRSFDDVKNPCIDLLHNVQFSLVSDVKIVDKKYFGGKKIGSFGVVLSDGNTVDLGDEKSSSMEKNGFFGVVDSENFDSNAKNVDLGDENSSSEEKIGFSGLVDSENFESNAKVASLGDEKSSSVEKNGSWEFEDSDNVELNAKDVDFNDRKSSRSSNVRDRVDSNNVETNANVANLSDEKSSRVQNVGSWGWVDSENVISCGFQKLGHADSCDLLNGSWVVVAGDSQARLFSVSLLGLVLGEERLDSVKKDLFKRHTDYHIEIGEIGMKLDFIWAPYVDSINDLVIGFRKNGSYPDVLVMGAGLWHMLHMADPSAYGFSLRKLRESYTSFVSPHVFWLGMPTLINSMLNTEEKREKMTGLAAENYGHELHTSKLLRGSGGKFLLIDVEILSRRCGRTCTEDGMHYDRIVYEAAVHILLNALLIESNQKL